MNFKKTIFISILLLVLSMAVVSASDLDNNYVTESDDSLAVEDYIVESSEIQNSEILTASAGTFDDLQVEINNAPVGSVLNLTRDYNGAYGSRIHLNSNLTIDGQGHTLDCLGEGGCSAFYSSSGNIVLKNLRIINGHNDYTEEGGAIYITGDATYTLINCIFENNWAEKRGGAIYYDADSSYGSLTIENCTFNNNLASSGGAIYDDANSEVIIKNSVFSSNTVEYSSGAFYLNEGNLYVENSVFEGNSAEYAGGGLYTGSGVNNLTVKNSIFKENSAGTYGGGIYSYNDAHIIGCLFESNVADAISLTFTEYSGAAISSYGTLYIDNSTFRNNFADESGGAIDGHAIYINYNQDANQSFNTFFIGNVADDSCGGAIRAFDVVYAKNTVFSSNKACVDGGAIYSLLKDVTVINCLFESNKADGATVSQCYGGAIRLRDGDLYVENSTFKDNYADDYGGAIYANAVYINNGQATSQAFNSFFINNRADDNSGGAIYAENDVKAANSVFSGNTAFEDGGAVYAGYDVNVKNCVFYSNNADGASSQCYGGAIRAKNDVTVDNCTFKDNYAHDYGGAIYGKNVFVNRNDAVGEFSSFFIINKANDDKGGAIYADDGSVTIVNAVLSKNVARVGGGAIYGSNDVTVDNCTFKDNYAYDYGGAIYGNNIYVNNNQGSNEAFNSFFIGNNVGDNDGGALYSYCDTHAKNAVFTGNSAYEDGGAIFCCDNAYITHCLFESNKATGASAQSEGGAIHCKDDLTVENSTFNKNYAFDYGGAIYADTLALRGYSYFDSNTAYDNCGGAIWVNKFREDVKFATFTNNKAGEGDNDDGGAIYIDDSNSLTFSQCVFVNNHCNDEGGAIYLDSYSSHLTLSNNIFVSNSAGKKGQAVYNYGKYDSIYENWWGGKNPSSDNDELIEWKLISDDHHSDSNPLKLTLKLTPESCNVNDSVSAIVSFNHNDGSNCSNKMRTEYISLLPTENITFNNRTDHESYMDTLLTPQKSGTYVITANLFGQLIKNTLSVSDNSLFTGFNNVNNLNVFDNGNVIDNYILIDNNLLIDAIVGYVVVGNTFVDNSFVDIVLDNNQTGNNTSNVNNASTVNNQSNSNAPVKSVNPSGNSNNLMYWALALVIIALCAIIVWRKMKN